MNDEIRALIKLAHEADGELSAIYHRHTYDREDVGDLSRRLRSAIKAAEAACGSAPSEDTLRERIAEWLYHRIPGIDPHDDEAWMVDDLMVLINGWRAGARSAAGPAAESPSVSPMTKSESRKTPAPGDAGGPLGTNCANGGCPSCHFLQCTCGCHRDAEADPIRYPDFNVLTPAGSDAGTECGYRWATLTPRAHGEGDHRCTLIGAHAYHICVVCGSSRKSDGDVVADIDHFLVADVASVLVNYHGFNDEKSVDAAMDVVKLLSRTSADDDRVQALVSIGAQALWIEKNEPGSPSAGWASTMLDLIRAVLPAFDSYTRGNGVAPRSTPSNGEDV